jgi:hypothetical protein
VPLPPNFHLGCLNPSAIFADVPAGIQQTTTCPRPITEVVLAVAFLLEGSTIPAHYQGWTADQIHADLLTKARYFRVPLERIFAWAHSILLPPEVSLTGDEMAAVPTVLKTRNFVPHPYQRESAAWGAARLGSVFAFGCGVGKTITAVLAAIAAVRLGKCSAERLFIIHPLNARGTWMPFIPELQEHFKMVALYSLDSLHHIDRMERHAGGAVIFDEVHRLKTSGSSRSRRAIDLRLAFEWGVTLTGTLLHTGVEGLLGIQELACPGLSRVLDPYMLGRHLNCLASATFPTAHGMRRTIKMMLPGTSEYPKIAAYARPSTISLSYESDSVRSQLQVPKQNLLLENTWLEPEDLKAAHGLWPPTTDEDTYLAAMALAIQHEREHQLIAALREDGELVETVAEAIQLVTDKSTHSERHLIYLKSYVGLPGISRLITEAARDGRYDRYLVRIEGGEYRFLYRNGTVDDPGPGPKIQWVFDLIDQTLGEPMALAAKSTGVIHQIKRELTRRGIPYSCITGETDARDRPAEVEKFQQKETDYIILQQVAGSESIALTRAAISVLVDHDMSPIAYSQFIARTARQGQTRETVHYDLAFNPTQRDGILLLRRGENFDRSVRKRIEAIQIL